jgi:RNA polymerase sigma factor (sigma-70 family)
MDALNQPRTTQSLEDFLERLRPRIRSLFARYRIPVQDTEDLLQQSLLALVYQWEKVRDPEAWLVGTLRKTCLLYWRERRRRLYDAVDTAVLEWMAQPERPDQERGELRHDFESLIAKLPPRCQALLRLRYRYGLEPLELAERLGYRPSSISKVSTRCLAAVTRQIAASGVGRKRGREG